MKLKHVVFLGVALLLLPVQAHAANAGGGLPVDAPLNVLVQGLTGRLPWAASILGLVVSGFSLIWGGEMGYFVRGVFVVVVIGAFIVFANNTMAAFGFGAGAEVTMLLEHLHVYVA